MELQVVLIGAVVFVISAVLIYLISAFTMKEKTFEEVIAEQKREQEEKLLKVKQEKKAEKDARKRFKPKGKVKGDQSPQVSRDKSPKISFSELDKEPKMVNIELDPVIIEPVEAERPLKMSKKKEKPAKPILHNKDEKTPVVSEEFMEEIIHRGPAPKDDVELKHIQDSKKEKSKKELKEKKKHEEIKPVVEEIMTATENRVQAAAPPMGDGRVNYKEAGNSKLIASVKAASLSENDAQTLIDILLTKQGGVPAALSTDWNKKSQKGDPVALLRKQLEEKERALQEEQQMVMAGNTKLKEIRQELNQEKMKYQSMEKNFKDKMEYQGREVQALHSRIQHTHDQHMGETNQMRTMIQKLEAQVGDQTRVQRLIEENNGLKELLSKTQTESLSPAEANNLKQKVSILEKELSSNALKLNASENTKKTLEQKLAKRESELQKYESQQSSNENVMEKRVEEIGQELRKSEAKVSALNKDLHTKEQAVETAQKECKYLKSKLQELEKSLTESDQSSRQMEEKLKVSDRQKIDIEGNLKNLQKRIEGLDQEKSSYLTEIQFSGAKGLKQENRNLATELKTAKERNQTEAQDTVKKQQNGDLHAELSNMISIEDHEKQLAAKVTELTALSKDIECRNSELNTLKEELEKQKKKNNELREKNWKAMDALEKSEKSVSEKVQSAIKEKGDELTASLSEVETFDQSVMQRMFPDISVKQKSHKNWMTEFEKQVTTHLNTLKQQSASSDNSSAKNESRMKELESQTSELENRVREAEMKRDSLASSLQESETSCSRLQTQVTQYRNVLGETENKLTQLENSVEAEEKKWQERLQAKELELQQAQQEIANSKEEARKAAGSQEDISDIGFAYRCVEKSLTSIVDEMKERVAELETELSSSQEKCSQLESQVKQAENKLSEYNIQIVELKKSSANITVITNDLEDLRTQLEKEQKKNKDLASQIVKLNGIIKTGHDALTQEQNLVKKLQEQMQTGNGHQNSTTVPNDSNTEMEQLRTKLHDKEKQLEKEISANKLLSQRLASSQSSLNEAGTSV
ncbi:ribosome-binding protein 1-like isoform X3 [Mercenaria mercenaria]|uniref:ribosome-binding protein 1-like isoform X3 n=1 Tax=Mercenaria mercenaria TaxID=6596 RepID=UPI00234F3146|nr:ribosome-binding protein 1-like isoform X3 [Mercenaria mercenaria]